MPLRGKANRQRLPNPAPATKLCMEHIVQVQRKCFDPPTGCIRVVLKQRYYWGKSGRGLAVCRKSKQFCDQSRVTVDEPLIPKYLINLDKTVGLVRTD